MASQQTGERRDLGNEGVRRAMNDRGSEKTSFTLEEAARYLGVSPGTVARWARMGRLRATMTGEGLLFERAHLSAVRIETEEDPGELTEG